MKREKEKARGGQVGKTGGRRKEEERGEKVGLVFIQAERGNEIVRR